MDNWLGPATTLDITNFLYNSYSFRSILFRNRLIS